MKPAVHPITDSGMSASGYCVRERVTSFASAVAEAELPHR